MSWENDNFLIKTKNQVKDEEVHSHLPDQYIFFLPGIIRLYQRMLLFLTGFTVSSSGSSDDSVAFVYECVIPHLHPSTKVTNLPHPKPTW